MLLEGQGLMKVSTSTGFAGMLGTGKATNIDTGQCCKLPEHVSATTVSRGQHGPVLNA